MLRYDETFSRAQAEMLVLNVARARHGRPLHFTTVSGIAATFEVRADASLGGELAKDAGISLLMPQLGFGVSASPTLSILPIQGEEFTRRLLTPLDQSTLGFFYHQGIEVSTLVRLMAQAVILEREDAREVVPALAEGERAETFRSLVSRLDALDEVQRLEVGPLVFEQSWAVPGGGEVSAVELADLVDRGYALAPREGGVALTRRVVGRQAITDYDPATLSGEELTALERRAQEYPAYFVLLDLRGSRTEPPVRGWIKLRSLASVIESMAARTTAGARSGEEPLRGSPLPVVESERPLPDSLFSVRYEGLSYSVPRTAAPAFRTLYSLFEMAVARVPDSAVPSVTIAK